MGAEDGGASGEDRNRHDGSWSLWNVDVCWRNLEIREVCTRVCGFKFFLS